MHFLAAVTKARTRLVLTVNRSNALDSLDEPVFCANLNHDARELTRLFFFRLAPVYVKCQIANYTIPAGSYDFGFINSTFTNDLTYVSVTKLPGYWKFTSSGYGVGTDL